MRIPAERLFLSSDIDEMDMRFMRIEREHNEREEELRKGFLEAEHRALFDWDIEVPEFNFDW